MDNELTSSSSENIRVSLSHRRRRQAIATPSATRSATLEARAATSAGGKGDDIGSDGGGDALVAEVALDAGLGMTWAETETVVPSRTSEFGFGDTRIHFSPCDQNDVQVLRVRRTARSCPLSPRPRWRSTCCCASVRAARRSSPSSCASPTTCRPSLRWATRPSRSCTLTC